MKSLPHENTHDHVYDFSILDERSHPLTIGEGRAGVDGDGECCYARKLPASNGSGDPNGVLGQSRPWHFTQKVQPHTFKTERNPTATIGFEWHWEPWLLKGPPSGDRCRSTWSKMPWRGGEDVPLDSFYDNQWFASGIECKMMKMCSVISI